jgi:hypothetical protein
VTGGPESGGGHAGHAHGHDGLRLACGAAEPVVFAGRADLTIARAADVAELQGQVGTLLAELCRLLREAGCTLVGHIKGSLDGGDGAVRQFSVTALDGRVTFRGDWRSEAEPASLTLNAIVFGIGEAAVADAVADSFAVWPGVKLQWR